MAIYEYQCGECDNIQDELRPMSAPTYEVKCNKCNSNNMKKIISRPNGYVKNTQTPTKS